jgi:hypothetical protein
VRSGQEASLEQQVRICGRICVYGKALPAADEAFPVELMSACILQACLGSSQQQHSAGDNCFPATAQYQQGCTSSGVQLSHVLCKPRMKHIKEARTCALLCLSHRKLALHCCTAVRALLQAAHSCCSG